MGTSIKTVETKDWISADLGRGFQTILCGSTPRCLVRQEIRRGWLASKMIQTVIAVD